MNNIDPSLIPQRTLASGAKMPAIGYGTFGSDYASDELVANCVFENALMGYRHFDCASVYGNEDKIGLAFKKIFESGIKREELFVTSKVWNNAHSPKDLAASCRKSLKDLQLDYLDMYLVHWPFPNFHPPKCDVASRSDDSKPYIHEAYMETWGAMEKLYDEGLVRHIGTSNMTIAKLELLLRDAKVKPFVNEMELHPHFQQPKLYDYLKKVGIEIIGFSPVGSPARPERDRTSDDTCDIEDPVMIEIAAKHGIHPATLCIKWAVQLGHTAIPFSTKAKNSFANLHCLTTEALTDAEMKRIASIDKNCRLIKGQVFLWKDGQNWEDLWDENGVIAK